MYPGTSRSGSTVRLWMAVMVATVAIVGGACGGEGPAPAAVDELVLAESKAPAGTEFAASLSWDKARPIIESGAEGVVRRLEELGLQDAAVSVFSSLGADGQRHLDLEGDDRVVVTAALAFADGDGARAALEELMDVAVEYAGAADVAPDEFDAGQVFPGAIGITVAPGAFRGGAAAIAWTEGDVVRLAFTQGGQPRGEIEVIATGMNEPQGGS